MNSVRRTIVAFENYLLITLFSVTTITVFTQVVARYVITKSPVWIEELARYLIIWTILIGSAACARLERHVTVDVLGSMFPKQQKYFRLIALALGVIFSATVVVMGGRQMALAREFGQVSSAMRVPMYIPYAALPVGCALMCFHFADSLITSIVNLTRGKGAK